MNINFLVRPSKARKDGLSPIEVSLTLNGDRKVLSLDRKVNPKHWNSKSQSVKNNKEINDYLQAVKQKFYTTQTELLQHNIPLTLDNLLQAYTNGIQKTNTILSIYDEHNKQYKQQVQQTQVHQTSLDKYIKAREYLYKYIKQNYQKEDMNITSITPSFIDNHYTYLLNYMNNNSALKIMKRLKRIIQIAIDEGYITTNPWKFKGKETQVEHHPLTPEELQKIKDKKITNPRLNKIRYLFLLQCYSGLSYADLNQLSVDDIQDGMIIKQRKKTNITYCIPALPQLIDTVEIIRCLFGDIPRISNQKYCCYLKELADICGIEKNLHSHLGRHTFATLLINNGVPLPVIAKTLGHSSTRITEKTYAKMRVETVKNEVMKIAHLI